jgi:hypothetical protein
MFQGQILLDLPLNRWFFLAVATQTKNSVGLFTAIYDCQVMGTLAFPLDSPDYLRMPLSLTIGGGDVPANENFARITQPAIFPVLDHSALTSIFHMGLVNQAPEFPSPPYHVWFDYGEYTQEATASFLRTLVNDCHIHTLLFLFRTSRLCFPDGDLFTEQLAISVQILGTVLRYSPDAQQTFYDEHGVDLLSLLLEKQWARQCSYKVFLQFGEMAASVTHSGLQEGLFKDVLIGFPILAQMPNDTHLRILTYWRQSMASGTLPFLRSAKGFPEILTALRLFYCIEPGDSALCGKRNPEIAVMECRARLHEIMIDYAANGVCGADFRAILGSCLDRSDPAHCLDVLEFTLRLLEQTPSKKLHFNMKTTNFARYLLRLLQSKQPAIHIAVFKMINYIFKIGLLSTKYVTKLLRVIVGHFPKPLGHSEFFEFIVSIIHESLHLEPLFCYLSLRMPPGLFDTFVQSLIVDRNRTIDPFWIYWHLALCTAGPTHRRQVLQFISEVTRDDWKAVFFLIDRAVGPVTDAVKCELLESIADLLVAKRQLFSTTSLTVFWKLVQAFLFARRRCDSCFGKDFEFCLRFSDSGEWLDRELASKCVQVYCTYLPQHFLQFALMLFAHLCRSKHPDCSQHFARLGFSDRMVQENPNLVQYIMYYRQLVSAP